MLVLSRKLGERIVINNEITVTVIEISKGKIRLGVDAPRGIPIYREELLPVDDVRRPENKARDNKEQSSAKGGTTNSSNEQDHQEFDPNLAAQ